jgi:biopolymer transport protein ExbD
LQRFIYKPEFSYRLIERKRFWIGLISNLAFSTTFYLFGLALKNGLRIFSELWTEETWYLTSKQNYFLNYYLAFISITLGSVVMFEIWFNKPKKLYAGKSTRTSLIFVEAKSFIWYFIYWLFSILVLPWYYFGVYPMHYYFDFLQDYYYLFLMLMVVLYLSIWTGILRKYKSMWKFLGQHFIFTIMLAAILALYVPQSVNSVTNLVRSNQIVNKYSFDPPCSNIHYPNRIEKLSLAMDIHVVRSKDSTCTAIKYLINKTEYSKDQFKKKIKAWRSWHEKLDRFRITARLFVDQNIPMSEVIDVRNILIDEFIYRIFYAIKTTPNNCNQPSIGTFGILRKHPPSILTLFDSKNSDHKFKSPPLPPIYFKDLQIVLKNDTIYNLWITAEGKFMFGSENGLLDEMPEALEKNWRPGFRINLMYEIDVSYENYIRVHSYLSNFILEKRNLHAMKYFGKNYYELYTGEEYRKVHRLIPNYSEFSSEEIEFWKSMDK